MREKKPLALGVTAVAAVWCGFATLPSASATGPELRTVVVTVSPQNAAVAVDGHPRQHRNGSLELRGPLGSTFTVEVVANGSTIIERVAVTDVGALPGRLVVPPGPPAAIVTDECAPPFWRDTQGKRHFKAQCLALDEYPEPEPPKPPSGLGELTIVCFPKCDRILDNGIELGPGHIFNRQVVAGRHKLDVSAPNGVKRSLVVEVTSDQTKEVRVAMDPTRAAAAADLLADPLLDAPWAPPAPPAAPTPNAGTEEVGYLTLASYPWSKVSEGGRTLCLTPCAKIPLSPGVHVLVLENESAALSRSVSVTIQRGEITTKRFAFK